MMDYRIAAWRDALSVAPEWDLAGGLCLSISQVAISGDGRKVIIFGKLERDGTPIDLSWPVEVANPPDHAEKDRYDPTDAIRSLFSDLAAAKEADLL